MTIISYRMDQLEWVKYFFMGFILFFLNGGTKRILSRETCITFDNIGITILNNFCRKFSSKVPTFIVRNQD